MPVLAGRRVSVPSTPASAAHISIPPEFRLPSKSSKFNAATADIPSSINVLEEDVSENPEFNIVVQGTFVRFAARTTNTNIGILRDASRDLNEAGEMPTSFPSTSIETGVLRY
jgi:hypothetical protein